MGHPLLVLPNFSANAELAVKSDTAYLDPLTKTIYILPRAFID